MRFGFFPSLRASDAWSSVPGLSFSAEHLAAVCLVATATPEYRDPFRSSGTGFLVAPNVVMTAAHVVDSAHGTSPRGSGARGGIPVDPQWLRIVHAETVNTIALPWAETPRRNRAVDVVLHPDYVKTDTRSRDWSTDWYLSQYFADVAMILLDDPVGEVAGVRPRPFPFGSAPTPGRMAMAAGYGPTEEERPTEYRHRRYAASYVTHNTPTGIVTRYPGDLGLEGQLKGDSGGPLIVPASDGSPSVVGVLSQTWPTGVRQVFAGYTRIDTHLSWITSVLREWSDPTVADRRRDAAAAPSSSVLPWVLGGAAVLGLAAVLASGGKK